MMEQGHIFLNFPQRVTGWYLFVMLAGYPLFTGPEGYIYLTEKKFIFFAVCTSLWFASLCVWNLGKREHRRIYVPDLLVAAFCLLAAAATMFGIYRSWVSMDTGRCDGLLTYLLYGCILIGVFHYGIPRYSYLWVLAISYSVMCVIAILQLCGYNPWELYPNQLCYYDPFVQEVSPFLGTLGNIDVFSAMHTLAIPVLAGGMFCEKMRARWCLLIPVTLGLICVLWVRVASGMVALFLTGLFLMPFVCSQCCPVGYSRRSAFLFGCLFCTGVFGLCMLWVYMGNWNSQTLLELQKLLHGEVSDSFGSHRIQIWKRTMEIIRDNPVLGIGPDNLGMKMDIVFERYSEALEEWLANGVDNAHNEYLQYLASFGILGTMPLAVLQGITWIGAAKKWRDSKVLRILCPAMVCYQIQALFNIGLCFVSPLFFIAWAFVLKEVAQKSIKVTGKKEK